MHVRTLVVLVVFFVMAPGALAVTYTVTMAVGTAPFDIPHSLVILINDTVTWQNPANSGLTHTLVADDSGGPNSAPIAPGGSYSFTFTVPGTYRYHCTPHGGAGGGGESGIIYVFNRRAPQSGERTLALNAWDFDPAVTSSTPLDSSNNFRTGAAVFVAGVHLPEGSQITGIELYGCDTDLAASMTVELQRCQEDTPAAGPSPCVAIFQADSGVPTFTGCGFFFNTSAPVYPELVDNLGRSYVARVNLSTSSLRFRTFRVFYRQSIGFPPANPTFTDVPATHPLFRFVEQLYAAGITGGCSASPPQYCPDAPLTRGQMAVFLTQALGLNWPY